MIGPAGILDIRAAVLLILFLFSGRGGRPSDLVSLSQDYLATYDPTITPVLDLQIAE